MPLIPSPSLTWSRACTCPWRKWCWRSSLWGRAHTPCPCWAALSERPTDKRTQDRRGHLEIGQEALPGVPPPPWPPVAAGRSPPGFRGPETPQHETAARPGVPGAESGREGRTWIRSGSPVHRLCRQSCCPRHPSFVSRPGSCCLFPFSQVCSLLSPSPGFGTENGSPLTTLKGNFLPWPLLINNLTSLSIRVLTNFKNKTHTTLWVSS